jgi:hypothetical protein
MEDAWDAAPVHPNCVVARSGMTQLMLLHAAARRGSTAGSCLSVGLVGSCVDLMMPAPNPLSRFSLKTLAKKCLRQLILLLRDSGNKICGTKFARKSSRTARSNP